MSMVSVANSVALDLPHLGVQLIAALVAFMTPKSGQQVFDTEISAVGRYLMALCLGLPAVIRFDVRTALISISIRIFEAENNCPLAGGNRDTDSENLKSAAGKDADGKK